MKSEERATHGSNLLALFRLPSDFFQFFGLSLLLADVFFEFDEAAVERQAFGLECLEDGVVGSSHGESFIVFRVCGIETAFDAAQFLSSCRFGCEM